MFVCHFGRISNALFFLLWNVDQSNSEMPQISCDKEWLFLFVSLENVVKLFASKHTPTGSHQRLTPHQQAELCSASPGSSVYLNASEGGTLQRSSPTTPIRIATQQQPPHGVLLL